ncbi:hypothetical protein GCM10022206_08510 [Streptomyces chiangmaiensis]
MAPPPSVRGPGPRCRKIAPSLRPQNESPGQQGSVRPFPGRPEGDGPGRPSDRLCAGSSDRGTGPRREVTEECEIGGGVPKQDPIFHGPTYCSGGRYNMYYISD